MIARSTLLALSGGILSVALLSGANRSTSIDTYLPYIGASGGTSFTRRCAEGHVLTGIRWRQGMVVDGIGIKCRSVDSEGRLGTEANSGSMAGGNGGTSGSSSCKDNFDLPSVITSQEGGSAGVGIADLKFRCYSWHKESESFGGGSASSTISVRSGVVMKSSASCSDATKPAVGIRGRHGSIVDQVALICAKP